MLPPRENLTLSAAAQYVAAKRRTSIDEARAAIKGALEDAVFNPTGRTTAGSTRRNIEFFDWRRAVINWDTSSAEVRGRYVHPSWREIELSRFQIDRWLQIAELRRRAHRAASPRRDRQESGASGGSQPAGSNAPASAGKNAARRDLEKETKITANIRAVHDAAQKTCTKRGRPMELAVLAEELKGTGGYKAPTIRKILNQTYRPAKIRDFPRFEWKPPRRQVRPQR